MNGNMQKRRVIVTLEIDGTPSQADAVRHAVGHGLSIEVIQCILQPLIRSEDIKEVKWEVTGESWMPFSKPEGGR